MKYRPVCPIMGVRANLCHKIYNFCQFLEYILTLTYVYAQVPNLAYTLLSTMAYALLLTMPILCSLFGICLVTYYAYTLFLIWNMPCYLLCLYSVPYLAYALLPIMPILCSLFGICLLFAWHMHVPYLVYALAYAKAYASYFL